MNNQVIFGNFLADDQLLLDNNSISRYCLELSRTTAGVVKSNEGGWHSENLFSNNLNPVLQPLYKEILDRVNTLHIKLGLKPDLVHSIPGIWANVNGHKDFNQTHRHVGAIFSGVYYVKVPENSGIIEFLNPLSDLAYTIDDSIIDDYNFFNSLKWEVTPKEGKILIWPSWLYHSVKPNLSHDTRISIAFNTSIIY